MSLVSLQFGCGERAPPLTREALGAARQLWNREPVADYDQRLLVEIDTEPARHYEVHVRGAKVSLIRMDGVSVDRSSGYSVDGIFDIMETELDMASDSKPKQGQPRFSRLEARFHPSRGFPLQFSRMAPDRKSFRIRVEEIRSPGQEPLYP
jgi:hypothetical protein